MLPTAARYMALATLLVLIPCASCAVASGRPEQDAETVVRDLWLKLGRSFKWTLLNALFILSGIIIPSHEVFVSFFALVLLLSLPLSRAINEGPTIAFKLHRAMCLLLVVALFEPLDCSGLGSIVNGMAVATFSRLQREAFAGTRSTLVPWYVLGTYIALNVPRLLTAIGFLGLFLLIGIHSELS